MTLLLFAAVGVGQANLATVPDMGNRGRARDYFRKQVRAERERRDWSQSHMAKLLSDKGIGAHTTTIAKIEAGDRAVPIDEAAAIADLFEVSLDKLLGRDLGPERDVMYTIRAALDSVRQSSALLASVEATLRDQAADVDSLDDLPDIGGTIATECRRAADALAEANEALRRVRKLPLGDGSIPRLTRKLLLDELQRKVADDEAQS
jgi:transcriptional regulator with XRE-family HTH domain